MSVSVFRFIINFNFFQFSTTQRVCGSGVTEVKVKSKSIMAHSISISVVQDDDQNWDSSFSKLMEKCKHNDVTFVIKNDVLSIESDDAKMVPDDHDTQDIDDDDDEADNIFHGNRMLFAAHSNVFDKMLFGSMMESNKSNNVIIHDLTCEQFQWLKDYVYHQDPKLTPENLVSILQMSDKYLMNHVISGCLTYIAVLHSQRCYDAFVTIIAELFECGMDYHVDQLLNMCFIKQCRSKFPLQPVFNCKLLYKWKSDFVIKFIDGSKVMQTSSARQLEQIWQGLIDYCKNRMTILSQNNHKDTDTNVNNKIIPQPS